MFVQDSDKLRIASNVCRVVYSRINLGTAYEIVMVSVQTHLI